MFAAALFVRIASKVFVDKVQLGKARCQCIIIKGVRALALKHQAALSAANIVAEHHVTLTSRLTRIDFIFSTD